MRTTTQGTTQGRSEPKAKRAAGEGISAAQFLDLQFDRDLDRIVGEASCREHFARRAEVRS